MTTICISFLSILCPSHFDFHPCYFWTQLVLCFGVVFCALSICILIFLDCTSCRTSLFSIIAICPSTASLLFKSLGNLLQEFSSACQKISFWLYLSSSLSCLPNSNVSSFIDGGIEPYSAVTSLRIL